MYRIKKIGNRSEPETKNQDECFDFKGMVLGNNVCVGYVLKMQCLNGDTFQTSIVRSIYHHDETSGYDKLILPSNFPKSLDLKFPTLEDGDLLIGTMNSVYLIRQCKTVRGCYE